MICQSYRYFDLFGAFPNFHDASNMGSAASQMIIKIEKMSIDEEEMHELLTGVELFMKKQVKADEIAGFPAFRIREKNAGLSSVPDPAAPKSTRYRRAL